MRFFSFFLFAIALLIFGKPALAASSAASSCPTEKLVAPITPEKLQSFLQNKKIKKVEDLICCLPPEFQKSYVVIHSGFAFQAGVPDHPRVIMYQPDPLNKEYLGTAISITGDDKSLHGSNNVEIMSNNETKKEAELYDIDFSKNHQLSEKNPQTCLGCHAPNSKDLSVAGVKPVFTDSPWPYAVGIIENAVFEQKGREYFGKIADHAQNAIRTQPRYSCLQPLPMRNLGENLLAFNNLTTMTNRRRVAKLMTETPDYKRFRPLIVGAGLGCFDYSPSTKQDLENFDKEFSKWVPSSVARSLFSDDDSLRPEFKSATSFKKIKKEFRIETVDKEQSARDARSKITDVGDKTATFYPTSDMSLYAESISKTSSSFDPPFTSLKGLSEPTKLFARYAMDTYAQHDVGTGTRPLLRFLFEARGISTLSWSRSMAAGYNTFLDFGIKELKEQTVDDPYWKDIGPLVNSTTHLDSNTADRSTYENKKKLCSILSQQSMRIFSNGAANAASPSTGTH